MINIHKVTRYWKNLGIVSCFALSSGLLLLSRVKESLFPGSSYLFVLLSFVMFIITIIFILEVTKGKIITSSSGIEWFTVGNHIKTSWEEIDRIETNKFGRTLLIFKQPIYKNSFVRSLLYILGSDKKIELTSYIDNPLTSKLLSDIKQYAPHVITKVVY